LLPARTSPMAELEAAIERLEQAVTRLEAARRVGGRGGENDALRIKEIANQIMGRVDRALARIGRVLGEGG
jgi:hypothetical protein